VELAISVATAARTGSPAFHPPRLRVSVDKGEDRGRPVSRVRHFHASYHIELGTNVKVVQERLGHVDVSTTMRFYVHNRSENHRNAADAFDAAFGKINSPRTGT
jgi:integrase